MHADFCVEALKEALDRYGPPEIMNPDQGCQFTGSAWITTLSEAGVKVSMDKTVGQHSAPLEIRPTTASRRRARAVREPLKTCHKTQIFQYVETMNARAQGGRQAWAGGAVRHGVLTIFKTSA